ncbi:MAG: hypothetical protein WBC44_18105 [Planctomycetaceae bacterium]
MTAALQSRAAKRALRQAAAHSPGLGEIGLLSCGKQAHSIDILHNAGFLTDLSKIANLMTVSNLPVAAISPTLPSPPVGTKFSDRTVETVLAGLCESRSR